MKTTTNHLTLEIVQGYMIGGATLFPLTRQWFHQELIKRQREGKLSILPNYLPQVCSDRIRDKLAAYQLPNVKVS